MVRIVRTEVESKGIAVMRPIQGSDETTILVVQGHIPSCPHGYELTMYESEEECDAANPDVVAMNTKAKANKSHSKKWAAHDLTKIYKLKEKQAEQVIKGKKLKATDLLMREAATRGIDVITLANQIMDYTQSTQALEDQEIERVTEKLSLSSE